MKKIIILITLVILSLTGISHTTASVDLNQENKMDFFNWKIPVWYVQIAQQFMWPKSYEVQFNPLLNPLLIPLKYNVPDELDFSKLYPIIYFKIPDNNSVPYSYDKNDINFSNLKLKK